MEKLTGEKIRKTAYGIAEELVYCSLILLIAAAITAGFTRWL